MNRLRNRAEFNRILDSEKMITAVWRPRLPSSEGKGHRP
jgi:hypothetical protein